MQGERPWFSKVSFLNIDRAEIKDKWSTVSKHKGKMFDWKLLLVFTYSRRLE